jgi:hypothetical protein
MKETRRAISIGVFTLLAVLGASWTIERAFSHSRVGGGATVSEPATAVEPAPVGREPGDASADGERATTPEYDRSDLLLTFG